MGKALKLSYQQREEIARKLFAVKSAHGSELHGLCPYHEDTNPSFSYNVEKDVFNCLACSVGGDLIKLWSKVAGSGNLTDDFKAFCRRYGIELEGRGDNHKNGAGAKKKKPKSSNDKPVGQADLNRAWSQMGPLPAAWRAKLKASRGWSQDVIDRLDLRVQSWRWDKRSGELKEIKEPERIAIPVFDTDGNLVNIRCYKPGAAGTKIFSFAPGCGKARLFPAKPAGDGIVLVTEGEADCICAISNGFDAITQTSKTKYWPSDQAKVLAGRDVVIAYDADRPGQKYARFAADCLVKVAKRVRVIVWPDWMGRLSDGTWPKDHGQDLTDFFVKHGKTAEDFNHLIEEAVAHKGPSKKTDAEPMRFFDYGPSGRMSFKPRLLADRVCADLDILSDPDSGVLYRWNGKYFEQFDDEYVEKYCIDLLGEEAQQSRVKDAVFQAKALSVLPHDRKLNDQTDWTCLENGMFNLRTMEIRKHDKDFYASFCLPFAFDPDRAGRCERWLQYLDQNIQTRGPIMQAQEFAGYCLTPEVRYEKALLLLGPGADGKSKFISILEALVGADNCSAVSFQDLEDQFHRSSLYGKLLNISTEVGSRAMESAYFKAIVSGDPISAAFKHQDAFHFRPNCKLVFAGNRLPRILDNSDGPFRRLLPIAFKRQFFEEDPDCDTSLLEKLLAELPDIFQWALVGLHRLWAQGRFTDCDETRNLLIEHRRANNPVLCFVEDECDIGEFQEVSKKEIYKRYKTYAGSSGYSIMGMENFFRELYAAVNNLKQLRLRKDGERSYYLTGIGLKPAESVP